LGNLTEANFAALGAKVVQPVHWLARSNVSKIASAYGDTQQPLKSPSSGDQSLGVCIMSHKLSLANHARRPGAFLETPFSLTPLMIGLLAAVPAFGQEPTGGLEEIIVTAEFRAANVQDTPIAITAVNASMLEARNQTNLAQITAQMPNVSLRPAGSAFGSALVAFIRGIGQTDFNPSTEPGIGIYVDDVYYSTITGNLLDLLDLERVEVLRGPQGTLAGRNAIGGAIKLFTRKPDGGDDAQVSLTKGMFNRTEIKGAAGLSLVPDKLNMRIAGVAKSMDGYVTRLDYACANRSPRPGQNGGLPTYAQSFGCELGTEGGQSYAAGRLGLRWDASDNFSVDFSTSIVNDQSESQPGVLVAAGNHSGSSFPILSPTLGGTFTPNPDFNPTATTFVPIYYDNNRDGNFDAGVDVPYDSRFVTGGTYVNYSTYINDGLSTPSPGFQGGGANGANTDAFKPYVIDPVNTLESWDYAVNLNWQLSDNTSLLFVESYRTYKNAFAEDTDGSPLAVQQLLQVLDHEQRTHELRLNTAVGERADLTFGAFYLDQDTAEDARVDLPYVGFDFIHGPDLVPATNQALYAHAALHLSERMELSLGVRHSEDEKSYTFRRRNPDLTPVTACALIPGAGFPNPFFWEGGNPANCGVFGVDLLSVSYSSDNTDYRVALSYDVGDTTMIYGQLATGYKAGGNNARPFFPSQLNAFTPETLDSFEVGLKTVIGGQLRLNAAVFMNDYTEIQLPSTVCTWAPPTQQTPCASQNNVGDAEVYGLEVEAEWHAGDQFTLDASLSTLNFEYQTIDTTATAVTLGMITPYTPESKWSLGAQYEIPFSGGGSITPRLDVSYTDSVYANAVNAPTNFIDDYTLFNARLTWRSADDSWQVALEGTNLTDEYYYVTLFDLTGGAAGYIHGQPSRPREWAMNFRRSF
jgi:iron complex outermembrane recepter protein